MAERLTPKLWSDFDGTAIEKLPKTNWRNSTKYPIPLIPGYVDFLRGVQSVGVDIAGVISRRHHRLRGWVTQRSVTKLGLTEFFDQEKIVLAGSEEAKGRFLLDQSQKGPVGMLEDRPHKLGPIIFGALLPGSSHEPNSIYGITIGVVAHENTAAYIDHLGDAAQAAPGLAVHRREYDDSIHISRSRNTLPIISVVPLEPYSVASGQAFAKELVANT